MQALMNIQRTNLDNPMCDWFARLYHPDKREFVIPGRGRIPLDEESVFNTLGVPNGGMDVPYKVDTKVQARLSPEMFPGLTSLPANSAFANMLGAMETSDDDFKRKLLMYLISAVFAPTTSLRPSNKCFPILVNALSTSFSLQSFDFDVIWKLVTASFLMLSFEC